MYSNGTNLTKATFSFIIDNKVTIVKYRKLIDGHNIIVMVDKKIEGKLVVPIHDKITLTKISLHAVRLLRAKKQFRYEESNSK